MGHQPMGTTVPGVRPERKLERWPHPCSREVDAAHCLGSADAMPRALVGDSQGPVDASVILFALKHGAQSVPLESA